MKKFIGIIIIGIVLIFGGMIGNAEAKKVHPLTSGVAVSDDCFKKEVQKCLYLTNTGTTSYVIEETDMGKTAALPAISVINKTKKRCTNHTFRKIEVTATGGSDISIDLICRDE